PSRGCVLHSFKKASCRLKAARRGAFHLIGRARFFAKKRPSSKNSPQDCFLNSPLKKAAGKGISPTAVGDQLFEKSWIKNF
ncbi:MAG: hypothetical protein IJ055_02960, partial [Oscillospiraceae bacterium]|nr:hypothetical protein [Oscillospiraceae bacterium]